MITALVPKPTPSQEDTNPTSYPFPFPEESFEENTEDLQPDLIPGKTLGRIVGRFIPHSEEDPINPTHYKGKEVFNQMVALYGVEKVKAFCQCNAYKYLARAGKKEGNSEVQDLQKCQWYLNELIQLING